MVDISMFFSNGYKPTSISLVGFNHWIDKPRLRLVNWGGTI